MASEESRYINLGVRTTEIIGEMALKLGRVGAKCP